MGIVRTGDVSVHAGQNTVPNTYCTLGTNQQSDSLLSRIRINPGTDFAAHLELANSLQLQRLAYGSRNIAETSPNDKQRHVLSLYSNSAVDTDLCFCLFALCGAFFVRS